MKDLDQIAKEFEEQEQKMSKKMKVMGKKGQVASLRKKRLNKLFDIRNSSEYNDFQEEDFSDE